jgi:hypothetical protein
MLIASAEPSPEKTGKSLPCGFLISRKAVFRGAFMSANTATSWRSGQDRKGFCGRPASNGRAGYGLALEGSSALQQRMRGEFGA